jgi:phosphoribosylamine--glycine ligase
MGTVSPSPNIALGRESEIVARIIKPVLVELAKRGRPFTGFLYAGLMIAPSGEINVVEFNARMGDPEAQVLVRRFSGDLMKTIYGLATNSDVPPVGPETDDVAVCVVMASEGYPLRVRKGVAIEGIAEAEGLGNIVVFQAGTAMGEETLITNGGRVLGVTAIGDSIDEARLKAYHAVERISFAGQQFRTDIGVSNQ